MSNLSELLPAGGGGKNVNFVASGTLGNGVTVALKADGTVEAIAETSVSAGLGTELVFKPASFSYNSVVMLTETKALVAYTDGGSSSHGKSCILTISGNTITAGSEVTFNNGSSVVIQVAALTASKAIVVYTDNGNSSYGTACVLDVSGTTITAGAEVVFESSNTTSIAVSMLDSTKAIVAYRDVGNGSYGTACVLNVSGTTITAGTPVVYESAVTTSTSVASLTSTKAIVTYRDFGNSLYGTSVILDVSGSTITAGTPTVFESANTDYIFVASLTPTKAIVGYKDLGNSQYGTSRILDVSGSTITLGTPVVFNSSETVFIAVAQFTPTKAIVTYRDQGNLEYGEYVILDVSGSTITAGSQVVYQTGPPAYMSVAALTSNKAIITYKNEGISNYGTGRTIQIAASETNLTATNFLGITDAAISSGASGSVTIKGGLKSELSSLTPNAIYYVQADGSVTTASTSPAVRIGKALSSTTLNLEFSS